MDAARQLPSWYDGAKFGLLVHYGPYTVPGWAERRGTMQELWTERGPAYNFKHNPYPEWYPNTIKISGSPARAYHEATYGPEFKYEDFISSFVAQSQSLDLDAWAGLFAASGARYAILTTKHHDGYCLWPSRHALPEKPQFYSKRDFVGEFVGAMRRHDLRAGLYYSGGFDKLFDDTVVRDLASLAAAVPRSDDYARYGTAQVRELVELYKPSILWNDIAWPGPDADEVISSYYDAVPDGVVNDRWSRFRLPPKRWQRALLKASIVALQAGWRLLPRSRRELKVQAGRHHHDFTTPEYTVLREPSGKKWEAVRGIGTSFGFNRQERDEDMLTAGKLVHLLVDIVSKNGNLLLGVGPAADGSIAETQQQRLLAVGEWLRTNGEAIYATQPWRRAQAMTLDRQEIRFTSRDDALYAIVLGRASARIVVPIQGGVGTTISLVGQSETLQWEQLAAGIAIGLPAPLPDFTAYALKISPRPEL